MSKTSLPWSCGASRSWHSFWLGLFFSSCLGDPHQFEQKFNYRRPMYPILRYMWGIDSYRESIKVRLGRCMSCFSQDSNHLWEGNISFSPSLFLQALADYASKNLEAMNPPLFLRFLNLLMNDAIFLLDEAIQVKHFYLCIHHLLYCSFSNFPLLV